MPVDKSMVRRAKLTVGLLRVRHNAGSLTSAPLINHQSLNASGRIARSS